MSLPHFKHQLVSLDFLRKQPCVLDASDPGTGKTRVAIEAFEERRMRGGRAALVMAPKSLLRAAWEADIRKFAPHLRVSIATAEKREAAFKAEADFYVTNHDAAVWLAKQSKTFFSKFDTLIIDELGAFKNSTSQRSKAVNKIKQHFNYRLGMNGTVTPNSVTDVWNQMFIIDDGQRLGPSFFAFRQAVCTPKQVGPSAQMIKWEDRPGASDAVSKLMEDVTIRHKFEDCIDIPANHQYAVPYFLSNAQQKSYDQMEAAQITLLGTQLVTAVNAATAATKLLQIASGAVYDESGDYHLIDTGRYELVLDMAEERQHTVIFFLWKHQKDYLVAEAKKRGLSFCLIDGSVSDKDRQQAVDFFQKGFYRICFAHPQSAAHGLTLTRGTATIWASPTYNLEHYQQGLKRIYRAGQTQKTETITIVAPNTIEDRVWAALQAKQVKMSDLLTQLETEREAA
jgi:SNF2 family DNA or RNA helicase